MTKRTYKTKQVKIFTETQLIFEAPKSLFETFAGSKAEAKRIRESENDNSIPDLFTCDPDYVLLDGEKFCFVELKVGNTHFVIVPDYEDGKEEKRNAILTAFFMPDFQKQFENIESATWGQFNGLKNAIAFRGGSGYVYSVWKYKG